MTSKRCSTCIWFHHMSGGDLGECWGTGGIKLESDRCEHWAATVPDNLRQFAHLARTNTPGVQGDTTLQ